MYFATDMIIKQFSTMVYLFQTATLPVIHCVSVGAASMVHA